MSRKPITREGYKNLQDELKELIKVKRPKIINDIEEARSHGDLKENAEYHAAKEQQGFIEGRIQHLNFLLANSDVVDVSRLKSDKVQFGATVTYEEIESGNIVTWKIVGEDETDVDNRKISIKSPIGMALLGKEEGDNIIVKIPKGSIEVEITSVEYL
jgi:transcription elongation factor GreA